MARSTRSGKSLTLSFAHVHSLSNRHFNDVAIRKPTYGDLIDIFEESELECPNSEELLCSKFKTLYPNIYIGRPRRFYETVLCIVAPTKPSLRGECKLFGSLLSSYRKRIWEPRIRNPATSGSCNGMLLSMYIFTFTSLQPLLST